MAPAHAQYTAACVAALVQPQRLWCTCPAVAPVCCAHVPAGSKCQCAGRRTHHKPALESNGPDSQSGRLEPQRKRVAHGCSLWETCLLAGHAWCAGHTAGRYTANIGLAASRPGHPHLCVRSMCAGAAARVLWWPQRCLSLFSTHAHAGRMAADSCCWMSCGPSCTQKSSSPPAPLCAHVLLHLQHASVLTL